MNKLILMVALICFGAVSANAQEKNAVDINYVEVTGSAIIKAVPDIAYINIVISEADAATKSIGVEKAEKNMIGVLKAIGLDVENDLSINDISSNFARRKNVAISKNYTLKLKNTKQLSELYSKLEGAGISNIEIDRFELSNVEELRLKAKVDAVKKAKEKARVLCEAAERKLGHVLYIIDYERDITPTARMSRSKNMLSSDMMAGVSESVSQIDVQEIEVVSNITTRWRIL